MASSYYENYGGGGSTVHTGGSGNTYGGGGGKFYSVDKDKVKQLGYSVPGAPSYVRSNVNMSGYKNAADYARANNMNARDIYTTDIRPATERNYPTTTAPQGGGTPRGSSGSGGGGSGYADPGIDYRQQLIDYYTKQNNDARDAALKAIEARLGTQKGLYENQFKGMNDNYDALINQAEVNYYKSKAKMREALANRGQLDSGLGRQETLNLNIARGNELGNINRQRQKSWDDYNSSLAQLDAEAEADKATIRNQYATELRNAIAQIMNQIL